MQLGLAPLTVGRPKSDVLMDVAADAGFAAVGVTLWVPGATLSPVCSDRGSQRRLRTRSETSGVSVADVGVVVFAPALDIRAATRLIEVAAALGAGRILVMDQDPVAERAAAGLAAVCAAAEEAALDVAVEFMPYTAARTLGDAVALIVAAGSPRARLMIDVLHLFRSGASATDLRGLDPRLIGALELCDVPRAAPPPDQLRAETLDDRRYPGDGELRLVEVLLALPPDLPMTVEAPVARDAHRTPKQRAASAAAAVRDLLSRVPAEGLSRCRQHGGGEPDRRRKREVHAGLIAPPAPCASSSAILRAAAAASR